MNGIYYRHWGEGHPIIVIHGLFGTMENLGMITRQLKDDYLVYAIDLPNHGRSAHTDEVSLASMANVIVNWMDGLGLEQVHILGHSLGGKVGMEIALRQPERINRLVVADIAPVQYQRRHDDVFQGFRSVDLSSIQNRNDADKAMLAHVDEASTRSFLLKNLHKADDQWQWRMNLDALERHYGNIISANTTDFSAFENPVLFVKGENSDYILPEHKDTIVKHFPQASVKIIHNTEHWLHAEKPDIFSGIVKRFLNA